MTKKQKGFTLIELLIVVAIIGILAAIAIPNLLTAMQRSKQKRTMADMRSIATAWEARATDMNTYASSGVTNWTWLTGVELTAPQVLALLSPTYIKAIPKVDGWSQAYGFSMDKALGAPAQQYAIRSMGKDSIWQGSTYVAGTGTQNFDCDIVYSNGSFIQYPEGMQSSQ